MVTGAQRGRFRFTWRTPPSNIANRARQLGERIDPELMAGMSSIASDVQSYMQANAPWNDRTGEARRRLEARANATARGNVTIIARHGVPYGGYLETGTNYNPWTGRGNAAYPIIGPGLAAHYAEVRKLMDRLASFG